MNMQFFSDYIDGYAKNNKDNIGKIVKVGKSSRGIDYNETLIKWNAIKNFFGLNEDAHKLFNQAVTGLELRRITQLNSSSLFAFLFFHSVSEDNGVKIKGFEGELFTNVAFEVNNEIDERILSMEYLKGRKPVSHIDVVLYNEKSAILLECKFSEYLEHYSCEPAKVARVYDAFYNKLFGVEGKEIDGLVKCSDDKNNAFITVKGSESKPCYYDGLKQTVAHFMGAHGILNSGRGHKNLRLDGKELHLVEVVFDFSSIDALPDKEREEANEALKTYAEFHKRLCEKLNTIKVDYRQELGRKITVHTDLLRYQHDFTLKLPSAFVNLYNLPEKFQLKGDRH